MPRDLGRRGRKRLGHRRRAARETRPVVQTHALEGRPDPVKPEPVKPKPEPVNDYPEDPEEYYNDRAERWSGRTY